VDVEQAIRARRSLKSFDPTPLDDSMLQRLFELVRLSPSSYNLQHWRFVVVRDAAGRAALRAAAFGQRHVEECGAVVVVCGKLTAHEDAERVQGHVPDSAIRGRIVDLIRKSYGSDPRLRRDEAIRSCSIAAMTLMLAAQSLGLATCPMIGFDPRKVAGIVRMPADHIPALLVVLGRPGPVPPFPTSRLPLAEIVKLETFDGAGLG